MRDINIDYDKFVLLNPEPLVLRDAVKLGRRLEKKGELYYKVASKEVELNSYLLDLASILPVGSNGGITIYKINADGTDVELNGELLRICNYELLGELDKIARMRFEMGMILFKEFMNRCLLGGLRIVVWHKLHIMIMNKIMI